MSIKQNAIEIVKTLQDKGFDAIFTVGCVRDMIMRLLHFVRKDHKLHKQFKKILSIVQMCPLFPYFELCHIDIL